MVDCLSFLFKFSYYYLSVGNGGKYMRKEQSINGILPLLKDVGMTSHDCVHELRKILHFRKIGHTGTLDPDVSGVLPICLGNATKVVQYMHDYPKTYIAQVTLGYSTTTEDRSGDIVSEKKVDFEISFEVLKQVLEQFIGPINQTPPMYSAVKVNGKRLYEYARAGIEVERPTRSIIIYDIELLSDKILYGEGQASFKIKVKCGKGTYIRTLAVDIGKTLGYPAHMSHLIRTAAGPFSMEECITLDEVRELYSKDKLNEKLYPIEKALALMPKYAVDSETENRILNGAVLPFPKEMEETRFSVYNEQGECIAIYIKHPNKPHLMKPEKLLKIVINNT
jgi:tRNA pseudouridine55 synthase